jgi:hypothetical protein
MGFQQLRSSNYEEALRLNAISRQGRGTQATEDRCRRKQGWEALHFLLPPMLFPNSGEGSPRLRTHRRAAVELKAALLDA